MTELLRRKEITIVIMMICAFFVLGDRLIKADIFLNVSKEIQSWALAISAGTMLVSFISAIIVNAKRIQTSLQEVKARTETISQHQWFYSAVVIGSAIWTLTVGLVWGVDNPSYQWMYQYIYQNLATAIAAFLALFYISAAFRAFRARTTEAALLLVTAMCVMLTTNPFGEALWSGFPVLGNFFLNWASLGGSRAVTVVQGIGTAALCFRVLLGYERGVAAGGGGE